MLWRHDIDMSPHRALRLATIEAAAGARTTYFVHLHSPFYNVLESPVRDRLRSIAVLGHEIGLHFDTGFDSGQSAAANVDGAIMRERDVLESLLGVSITTCSFHNPERDGILGLDADSYGGLLNTYGRSIGLRYTYVSDSNGYWRFRPLRALLASGAERLHVLTHPEWWTPTAMSPRDRVARCIRGRARAASRNYDAAIASSGRANIGR